MAVSTSKPLLEEAWIAVQFQLAGLTAEFEGEIPDAVHHVRDDAYSAIAAEYRGLPSMYPHSADVQDAAYDICGNDDDFQESQHRLTTAISFVSGDDFTEEAIDELKKLCVSKFTEAAAAHGIECAFAGIEGWRRFSYVEQVMIEAGQ
ncbi:MAG TPA: hypothetical protein VL635_23075 [Trinickia sp.]|nr:hypothetical protein [Trinickia sp.]